MRPHWQKSELAAGDGWTKRIDDPIVLADGVALRTLQQAVAYLAKTVPKAEQKNPKVATAAQMLTRAAEREKTWMFMARAATLQAIYRHQQRVFNPARKDHHWSKRKLKRDE